MIKLLFNTINIDNDQIDPIYIPKYGTILDKHNGSVLHKLKFTEISKFFYFKIEFDDYRYTDYYLSKNNAYCSKMSKRIYNLYLYLNLSTILIDRGFTQLLYRKLTYYLALMQIKELQHKKIYHTNENLIDRFINYRELNFMYLVSWYYFRINNNFVFDLVRKRLVPSGQVQKINFTRKGGIIETNNVFKLINDNFKINGKSLTPNTLECCQRKTLIILPTNMTDLWQNVYKITFDELLLLKQSDIKNLIDKNITQIIIHECHIQFLIGIKNLLEKMDCRRLWIINSLPLRYYFTIEKTPKKLNVNDLAMLTNLWLNFNKDKKKKYKTEIIRLLLTKFNQFYTIVNYNMDYSHIDSIKLSLVPYETYIYQEFNKYYGNWKNKLINDPNNIYSFTTKKKNSMIETKIFNAVTTLITSVVANENISKFFEIAIKNILLITISIDKELKEMIKTYRLANKSSHENFLNNEIINYNHIMTDLEEKKEKNKLKILNYSRYLTSSIYKLSYNDYCPICYSNDGLVKTRLICGHCICLECIINSLKKSNKCPICNEFINIQKIAIVKETVPMEFPSNIINYFKQLDPNTIILTDFRALNNVLLSPEYNNNNVININKINVVDKIRKINGKIKNIILFTTPKHIINNATSELLNKVLGFFLLFNEKPIINKIEIIM
jgi:hypothetical protein